MTSVDPEPLDSPRIVGLVRARTRQLDAETAAVAPDQLAGRIADACFDLCDAATRKDERRPILDHAVEVAALASVLFARLRRTAEHQGETDDARGFEH